MVVLTSSGFDNPEILARYAPADRAARRRAVIVTTGSIPLKDRNPNAIKTRDALQAFGWDEVRFVDVADEDPTGLLEADFLVILGGNARHLLEQVRCSGTDRVIRAMALAGVPVVGVSAGAMLLAGGTLHCTWIDPLLEIDQGFPDGFDHRGLGFAEALILPHMQRFRQTHPQLEKELSRIEEREGVVITRMDNGQWMEVATSFEVQRKARIVLDRLGPTLSAFSTEASVIQTCAELLQDEGVTATWYYQCPALVLLGSRSRLSLSGRDYVPSTEKAGQTNLVTVDLSPLVGLAWGDCARSFAVEEGHWSPEPRNPQLARGKAAQAHLHQVLGAVAHPAMTSGQLFDRLNAEIGALGYENLDFLANLGHSIGVRREDRVFLDAGNPTTLSDLGLFTFEPHIGVPGGPWGFKHEEIYRFDLNGRLVPL